jgi:hypothetical protein
LEDFFAIFLAAIVAVNLRYFLSRLAVRGQWDAMPANIFSNNLLWLGGALARNGGRASSLK